MEATAVDYSKAAFIFVLAVVAYVANHVSASSSSGAVGGAVGFIGGVLTLVLVVAATLVGLKMVVEAAQDFKT